MTLSQQAADAITAAAGWKTAHPDEQGVFHFRLEGNLDMEFFSPDGRTGIFRGIVAILPDTDSESETLLQHCAQRAVGSCKKRKSTLSLDAGAIQLHRTVRLDTLTADKLPQSISAEARDFLNDLAWWQAQVNSRQSTSSASPFSFSGLGGSWPLMR